MKTKNIYKNILCSGICCIFSISSLSAQQTMDKMWGNTIPTEKKQDLKERGKLFEWGNYAMFIPLGAGQQRTTDLDHPRNTAGNLQCAGGSKGK